jgi:hypothetical protein
MYPQEHYGILAMMAWEAYRAEVSAQKRPPQSAGNKAMLRQFQDYVGRVLIETGLKLQGRRQLSTG